jgi:hypothetical protein
LLPRRGAGGRDLYKAKPFDLRQGQTWAHDNQRLSGRHLNQFDRFQRAITFARYGLDTLHNGATTVMTYGLQFP